MVLAIAFEGVILYSGASESVPVYLQQFLLFAQMQLLSKGGMRGKKRLKEELNLLKSSVVLYYLFLKPIKHCKQSFKILICYVLVLKYSSCPF